MKKSYLLTLIAAAGMTFASCSNSDEPKKPDPEVPTVAEGAFIINQGNYSKQIEGSLTLIDYATSTASQGVFQKANGKSLGASPQSAVVYGSKIYICVYGSNVIQIINRTTFKSEKMISLENETGQSPRSLVAKDGKVYISMYNGYVSRLDTLSLAIDKTVQVGPNPEIMAIHGNYLYVPNSDGMNWKVGYGTTASKIDLAKFEVVSTFTVGLNPCQFASNGTDLFLLCKGDYGSVASKIYKVANDKDLTEIVEATLFDMKGNKLYYINAPYGAPEVVYGTYDIATGAKGKMITDDGVESPAGLGVDPLNGNIVITSYSMNGGYASYTTDGYAKVYDKSGALLKKYDVGVGPCSVFFNYK